MKPFQIKNLPDTSPKAIAKAKSLAKAIAKADSNSKAEAKAKVEADDQAERKEILENIQRKNEGIRRAIDLSPQKAYYALIRARRASLETQEKAITQSYKQSSNLTKHLGWNEDKEHKK